MSYSYFIVFQGEPGGKDPDLEQIILDTNHDSLF